ncbi:MAG: hypothetical protein Q7V88_15030 [Actinomycetota bacterium]|nr:hypothetical protein [Actinomycetota bacterium]
MPAASVHASDGFVTPVKVPPGGTVTIDVRDCAAGTTTVVIDIAPVGGAAFVDLSAAAVDGRAVFTTLLPIDLAVGAYEVHVMCKDVDATTIDTGLLTFEVAALTVGLSPSSGPVGTRVQITGSGCPGLQIAEKVVAFIEGASDETPTWDRTRTDGVVGVPNADGSFALSLVVPAGSPLGENIVSVWCVTYRLQGGSPMVGPFLWTFTVTEAQVPATGSAVWPIAWLALGLVTLGSVLVRAGRRQAS